MKIEDLKTKPHRLRDVFRYAGLTAADVAQALGLSLGRTQNLLGGRDKPRPEIEEKLEELARVVTEDRTED